MAEFPLPASLLPLLFAQSPHGLLLVQHDQILRANPAAQRWLSLSVSLPCALRDVLPEVAGSFQTQHLRLRDQRSGTLRWFPLEQDHWLAQLEASESLEPRHARKEGIGDATSALAHELRTPLATIRMITENFQLRQQLGKELTLENFAKLPDIVEQCDQILETMLALGRSPEFDQPAVLPLNKLVKSALLLQKRWLSRQQVQLQREFCDREPVVRCKPSQFEQTLGALCQLLILHTPFHQRERTLQTKTLVAGEQAELELRTAREGGEVSLAEKWAHLRAALAEHGGELRDESTSEQFCVRWQLPLLGFADELLHDGT
jgi:signal transduction histidine kinase